ncbi:hypothetical protein GUJ93_ZPchr0005g15869 [Zizania palustris]|uniref:Uncharacterized protein n=2 Tax=Zizania palustris TaxID=103762 RepID=A0A8J5S5D5_ZIZPA|nr:hypothetical protein GUJ93_ZPchr0005g15869 [Zizania palustris]
MYMEALPDIYPLTGLQIGDMQSYVSQAFLYFAPLSKKVLILVDNQPWLTSKQSRSARLWQSMVTKYRMSPFTNSRALDNVDPCSGGSSGDATTSASAADDDGMTAARRWFALADQLTRALHGFLVFEVSWRDVHGINYLNELLTDTYLALEARYMKKWDFYSAEQAAGCAPMWFLGRAPEAQALSGYLRRLSEQHHKQKQGAVCEASMLLQLRRRTCSPLRVVSELEDAGYDEQLHDVVSEERPKARWRSLEEAEPFLSPSQYTDTLIQLRFRDSDLPLKLRQIIVSDIRLLTLLESGLPSWVIFLQSYPLLCLLYRPWMRPLARSFYLLVSLATVIIGFYDLYKNVPLLKAAAARVCGPLFGWIETWDMVTRIQYLGTILFLRNLRKCLQGILAFLRMARALLRPLVAPLAGIAGPLLAACGEICEMLGDLAEALWAPLDAVFDCAVGALQPLVKALVLPARFAAALAGCAGSLLNNTYNFGKDIWETVGSMFEINHMAEAQQSAVDVSLLKALWNDLFSQIFRAIRSILNGILVFFASCNRHRLRYV